MKNRPHTSSLIAFLHKYMINKLVSEVESDASRESLMRHPRDGRILISIPFDRLIDVLGYIVWKTPQTSTLIVYLFKLRYFVVHAVVF